MLLRMHLLPVKFHIHQNMWNWLEDGEGNDSGDQVMFNSTTIFQFIMKQSLESLCIYIYSESSFRILSSICWIAFVL